MTESETINTVTKTPHNNAFDHTGVVEGFYGRVWTPNQRRDFIEFLLPFGLNTYLYAPKHEACLGSRLLQPLSPDEASRLGALANYCAARGITLVPGLHFEPPLHPGNKTHLKQLAAKVEALVNLGITRFAALFDDIPTKSGKEKAGNEEESFDSLATAQTQAFMVAYNASLGRNSHCQWWVCTSRYSLDPVLETLFGKLEPDYLERLHAGLPPNVAWLWTGPRVVSQSITPVHAADYLGGLNRQLVLWDNYPVNDAQMVNRLHLGPLTGRHPQLANPRQSPVRGYLFNPMLQPSLGSIPAATCLAYANDPTRYDAQMAWQAALATLAGLQSPDAREAFRWLAALTDNSPLGLGLATLGEGTMGKESVQDAQNPHTALWERWRKATQGCVVDPRLGEADPETGRHTLEMGEALDCLGEALAIIKSSLPNPMLEEARPWLRRVEALF